MRCLHSVHASIILTLISAPPVNSDLSVNCLPQSGAPQRLPHGYALQPHIPSALSKVRKKSPKKRYINITTKIHPCQGFFAPVDIFVRFMQFARNCPPLIVQCSADSLPAGHLHSTDSTDFCRVTRQNIIESLDKISSSHLMGYAFLMLLYLSEPIPHIISITANAAREPPRDTTIRGRPKYARITAAAVPTAAERVSPVE